MDHYGKEDCADCRPRLEPDGSWRGPDEDATVGIGLRAKSQTQDKIVGKILRGGYLLNSAPFAWNGDYEPANSCDKSAVGTARLTVEKDGSCDHRPGVCGGIAGLPFPGRFLVRVRCGVEPPTGEIFESRLTRLRAHSVARPRQERGCRILGASGAGALQFQAMACRQERHWAGRVGLEKRVVV